jgi:hypothetical protein
MFVALRFLHERGQLAAAGKDELAQADEEIVLLSEQIKAGAQAFMGSAMRRTIKTTD